MRSEGPEAHFQVLYAFVLICETSDVSTKSLQRYKLGRSSVATISKSDWRASDPPVQPLRVETR